jgi:parallel beta-helix repeat protein
LTGNIASNNSHGIVLDFSSNSNTLTGNAACNNSQSGIDILESSNFNTLIGNTASYNRMGFSPRSSSNFNTLTANTANNNTLYGFWLDTSSRNMLTSNTANNNKGGFWLVPSCNFNSLTANTASNNSMNGFYLGSSNNNALTGNTASHNSNGFYMWQSSSNLFYCNSIRLNAVQASSSSANTWHNGTHGNYWSDYTGSDRNNDSIGDTPYSITGEGNNEDPYPLMFDPVRNLYRPSAPQHLVGTAGEDSIELMWAASAVDGGSLITEYHIYRSVFSGFGYTQIGSSLTTSFTDTAVSNGATYFYVIRAVNAVGESPASNEVTIIAPAAAPAAPQSLQATAGENIVELTWTAPTSDGGSPITEYRIYRTTSSGAGYTQIGSSPTTSFTDTAVSRGVTYYYIVRAINIIGQSPDSNEATAATLSKSTTASKINSFNGAFFVFGLISLSLSAFYIRRRNNN